MGTTTRINTMCSSDWLTSSGVFEEQPQPRKKAPPANESDNSYEDIDSHTDTGAAYEPSVPGKKAPPKDSDDDYGDIDSHTDTGADYGPKNVKAKTLAMCEPVKPDGENWDEDDLGDVSDPEGDVYGFVPRRFQHDGNRFADDAIIFLARASRKKSTPVPSDRKPNGCDGNVPDGPYPEGSDNNSGSSSPSEPYDLPGLPPSWDEVLV